MNDKKNNRNRWLHLRLTEEEYQQLHKFFATTTELKLSSYCRKVLLGKPMTKGYRNLSLEAQIHEFSGLIKVLNGIANNFNQAVHKLHMQRLPEEFKHWLVSYEMDKRRLLKAIEDMRELMNKQAAEWLQS